MSMTALLKELLNGFLRCGKDGVQSSPPNPPQSAADAP
jgi:hypothetical protein